MGNMGNNYCKYWGTWSNSVNILTVG